MGESGRGFGSEVMRKSKLKKKIKKRKWLDMIVPNFLYNNSYDFFNIIITVL